MKNILINFYVTQNINILLKLIESSFIYTLFSDNKPSEINEKSQRKNINQYFFNLSQSRHFNFFFKSNERSLQQKSNSEIKK